MLTINSEKLISIYFPIFLFILIFVLDHFFANFFHITANELGFVENLQVIILFYSIIISWYLLYILHQHTSVDNFLKAWFTLVSFGVCYIFLEETSYGQHYFHWQTPSYWATINDQNETNLHNVSNWFDQKPRTLLELFIFLTGIVLPLRKKTIHKIPQKLQCILPSTKLFVVSLLAISIKAYDKTFSYQEWHLFSRSSEVVELYIYCFLALYIHFYITQKTYLVNEPTFKPQESS